MAFTSKFVYFILILLFSLALLTQTPSEWNCGHGCFYAEAAAQVIPNRKVLHGSIMHGKEDAVLSESAKVQGSATSTTGYGGGSENWELRRVPAGPDPLHHHGGSPKKPTTP